MTGLVSTADFGLVGLVSFESRKPTMKAGRFGRSSRTASFFMALDRLKIRLWMPSRSSFFSEVSVRCSTCYSNLAYEWHRYSRGNHATKKGWPPVLAPETSRRFCGLDLLLSAIGGTAEVLHYAFQTGRANRSFPNYRIIPIASVQPKRPNASPCSMLVHSREKPSQY